MKKILKAFLKVNMAGDKLYEQIEELVDDESGTIVDLKREVLSTCRSCGQSVEPNQARSNCPLCGECCNFCHQERLKLEKIIFERQIILERERLRWLESKIFDGVPCIGLIRQVKAISSIRRLESLHRWITGE